MLIFIPIIAKTDLLIKKINKIKFNLVILVVFK